MRRYLVSGFCFLLLFLLSGCNININEYPTLQHKPSSSYYAEKLAKDLSEDGSFSILLLETNYSTELDFNQLGLETFLSFINSLTVDNFLLEVPPLEELPEKPPYRLYITANNNRYVLDIYSKAIITLYPWDGIYSKDYITMEKSPNGYNLYGLSNYLLKNR